MCGSTPSVERRDIRAENLQADREATRKANAEIASRKAGRARSSLISNIGGASGLGSSAISVQPGRETLG
jgi:2-phosphoglycerate kinase